MIQKTFFYLTSMDITEVLQLVDQLVFEQTGKHLDNLQRAVLEGTWQKQTYNQIAEKNNFSKNHVGDTAYQLWELLSKQLGEDIKKSNFRSTVERLKIKSSPVIIQNNNHHNFNFGSQILNQRDKIFQKDNLNSQSKSNYQDLSLAPKIISNFLDRTCELGILTEIILTQEKPLISVLGLGGIGKTSLVRHFIELNLEEFEVIIWKSLKFTKSLDLLINDLLNIYQEELKEILDDKLKQLFALFAHKKCLIILDDVQNLFIRGEFAGQYQSEYQDYQNFFKMITETKHQSNIILISQEKCTEMECLDEELYPIKCLELEGLFNPELLSNWGLKGEDSWLDLINLYEGNLFYLKSVALLINNNYDGEVGEFLAENTLLITNQMQCYFREKFNHLSPPEQKIILQLGKVEQPMTREDLRQSLNLSSVDFNNGLQSLQKRYLVRKIKADKIMFKLSDVFREYVINCFKK